MLICKLVLVKGFDISAIFQRHFLEMSSNCQSEGCLGLYDCPFCKLKCPDGKGLMMHVGRDHPDVDLPAFRRQFKSRRTMANRNREEHLRKCREQVSESSS